jgi:hypothetical protein
LVKPEIEKKYYDGDIMIEGYAMNKNTPVGIMKTWVTQYKFNRVVSNQYQAYYGGSYSGIVISTVL